MHNIREPIQFSNKLTQLLATMYDLFELTREKEDLPSVINGGLNTDGSINDKCFFQVSNQYERPANFLDCLLDFIRVMFGPNPLGTFFLNSNPEFIVNAMPKVPFNLGYITAISQPNESIDQFYKREIAFQLKDNNYLIESASACFVMVSVNSEKYSYNNLGVDVLNFFNSGFTAKIVLEGFIAAIEDQEYKPPSNTHVGFSIDNSLRDEMRLSMWLFLKDPNS